MLKIENGFIEGFNVYEHRENLKFYRCMWDADAKKWRAPDNTTKIMHYIEGVNKQETEILFKLWKDGCNNCGYQFVKKGTEEYEEVKEEVKKLKLESKNKINIKIFSE